ncbi:MAG: metal-dependent hydrolase [Planctomycetota bacterium]|nr:MAG: metal-dependent hydrolase [Planctomycetota bacterium]REJ88330.1 MAG: metal-dependent hydrolase [Planctomycetota bacterium]REK21391.1 MAG: metal-dependent hydrolase [Planctomycetota bacterium]REK40098.1 MAG: metal-dependent hydrolase [Planctomycetota bacterium]
MAAYREHISVSGMLGAGVALVSTLGFGYTPVQGLLAGWLTAIGGILPDLDSESGRPVREIFGLTASVAPLLLIGRILKWTGLQGDPETVMVLFLAMYLLIKYGLASLIGTFSVHRGMFHSIPALIIAGEITYLFYPGEQVSAKLLMAGSVGIGFLSHLVLDEVYSVQWSGVRIRLKKSAGSAMKLFGDNFGSNAAAYTLLILCSLAMLSDAGIIGPPDQKTRHRVHDSTDLGGEEGLPVEGEEFLAGETAPVPAEVNEADQHRSTGGPATTAENPLDEDAVLR